MFALYPLNMGYKPFKPVILSFSGGSIDEHRVLIGYDMLICTVPLVERERNIIFGGGIFKLHPFTLYIPHTFHIPLSPIIDKITGKQISQRTN